MGLAPRECQDKTLSALRIGVNIEATAMSQLIKLYIYSQYFEEVISARDDIKTER